MKNNTFALCLLPWLSACQLVEKPVAPPAPAAQYNLASLYDYQLIHSQTRSPMEIAQVAEALQDTDIIFLGEFHTHQAAHRMQLEFIQALGQLNNNVTLSMEQFTRDAQPILSGYLAGQYGEETLIKDGAAWEDYKGSYRAVVEYAKQKQWPVIAANAPAMHVRCVGRQGLESLALLPPQQRAWSAQSLDLNNPQYQQKFEQFMASAGSSHGLAQAEQQKRMRNTFAAQLLRDATMAESILMAKQSRPNDTIVHLNGAFHSDGYLGTVAELRKLEPTLSIAVISPVSIGADTDLNALPTAQGDYLLLLQPLPERYLDKQKQRQAIGELIRQRMAEKCDLNSVDEHK